MLYSSYSHQQDDNVHVFLYFPYGYDWHLQTVLSKVVFHKLYLFLSFHYIFKMAGAVFCIINEGQLDNRSYHQLPCISLSTIYHQILFPKIICSLSNIINIFGKIVYFSQTLHIKIKLIMLLKYDNVKNLWMGVCVCVCFLPKGSEKCIFSCSSFRWNITKNRRWNYT